MFCKLNLINTFFWFFFFSNLSSEAQDLISQLLKKVTVSFNLLRTHNKLHVSLNQLRIFMHPLATIPLPKPVSSPTVHDVYVMQMLSLSYCTQCLQLQTESGLL